MRNPCRFVAAVATLCLFASAALAQPTMVGKAPAKIGDGNSGNPGGPLYDDPYNNGVYGLVSQDFSDYTSVSSRTYDDFTVPDGDTWNVDGQGGEGFYTALSNSSGCGVNYIFEIVGDLGGIPDCGNNICSLYPPAYDPAIETGNSFGQSGGRFDFCPGGECVLTAGTYWATVAINMPFAGGACGQWFFVTSFQPHRRGSNAYLDNPNGGFGLPPCVNWTFLGIDGDLTFTIYGTSGGGCPCGVRAGNTDTGNGNAPADTVTVDGSAGDLCRELTVSSGAASIVDIQTAPSVGGKGQYGLWYNDGDELECCALTLVGGKGTFALGTAAKCLAVNNTDVPGSVPCPVTFPVGRTSKSLGSGTAAALCLNKKPGFPKAPTFFSDTFPAGDYTIQGLTQDLNSINSPAKNIGITNAIAVHSL
jgi:hypothetical protein